VVAVFTQPDRPAGRGKKLSASPVKLLAADHQLPVHQPLSLKAVEEQQVLASYNADIMVVVAYGLLLPKAVLAIPVYGCINVHASLLPRWRGAAPIQRAIEAGDTETGVTIMQMAEGLDTGDMLRKARCPIEADDDAGSLHDKLAGIGPDALLTVLDEIAQGKIVAEKQDDEQSNYAAKITKQEALINWHEAVKTLVLKIRAFNPFPICYSTLSGDRIRIWKGLAVPDQRHNVAPGTIVQTDKSGILVKTGEGCLLITVLQLPGKRPLHAGEVLNAHADLFSPGTVMGT
jgi:methionyl-tRNA formyltransferase